MKRLFGGLNISWKKIIIWAILIGVLCGMIAMIPELNDTSINNINVSFEVWIFIGILIIMNSKSAKESALKCFVFFLISQPLIYLVQVPFSEYGWQLFKFYIPRLIYTIACLPIGFAGFYMKKNKWWGLLILIPVLVLLTFMYGTYLSKVFFSFPYHLLTTLFCLVTLIIYPLFIFKDKKIRIVGLIISILLIIGMSIWSFTHKSEYNTILFVSGENYQFDDTYNIYLTDEKFGTISLTYDESFNEWMVIATFKKAGKTQAVMEAPDGTKRVFNIIVKSDTYEVEEVTE